ncbi:hypothetical protein UFOVP349_40 [uncultured Caudovirales phage]|uniref:Uncharacterized protein n=1 Tax=uncultured Caudovirales phage TaxID=2100421 RepID=A0A6J5M2Z8_9CAUD|nr:hypothetical protein UFOVP349_40 [uncultured Caudovirales phage]
MARSAAPVTLTSQAPALSWDELTTCVAEASAILWAVKLRREARLADLAEAQTLIEATQEERGPSPKGLGL